MSQSGPPPIAASPRRVGQLRQLGVHDLRGLLDYFPRNYQVERAECPIGHLRPGQIQQVRGEVVAVDFVTGSRMPRFEATLEDPTGRLGLVWFNGAYLRGRLHPGMIIRVKGKVEMFRNMPRMSHPQWQEIDPAAPLAGEDLVRAIYPATAELPSPAIWKIVDANLPAALDLVEETLPADILQRRQLLPRRQAYAAMHRPESLRQAAAARRRLVYDELLLLQLGLALGRRRRDGSEAGQATAPRMVIDRLLDQRIRARFPFTLTNAQNRAIAEIARDLQGTRPMSRLLQGDVGSGKTVVALYAILVAIANRMQASLLAPTEVLAEQHYLTLSTLLSGSAVEIGLLTSRTKRQAQGRLQRALAAGRTHLAVGTQALLQGDTEFANLGLVVVDEQHRLGVMQRAELKGKGHSPHYLVMTATPIPRTLALSYFADFDMSTLDELPPGRRPIITTWLRPAQRPQAYEFIRRQVGAGRQAYVVMPQIADSGLSRFDEDVRAVTAEYRRLSGAELAGLRLGMLHGALPAEEKQRLMLDFREHRLDVLITTTVIEVGIDVPNATVMVIENAERFGLAQLHQIRGRVGRGTEQSHCLLIGDAVTEDAQRRLSTLVQTNDGFAIAQTDLELRGPGEFFGTRQHGLPATKLADITQEIEMLKLARDDALALLEADPDLLRPEHAPLRRALQQQFGAYLALGQVV